ncbi:MAG: hypothetical protein ABF420_07590 [Acetobacter syzygii]|uniref:hypothetical protein n=1 Tax=Acetobacter syzygii TaxID=146476 RepID=UPI0039EAC495
MQDSPSDTASQPVGERRQGNTQESSPVSAPAQGKGVVAGNGVSLPVSHLTVEDVLRWHSVPEPLIHALAGKTLADGLANVLSFGALPDATKTPLAFGGASGSGKTLVLAKLAARYILSEDYKDCPPPLVIACDHTAGSFAKLSALLQPYNIPIIQGSTSEILADAVNHKEPGQPILVDLPGICVYSPVSMSKMMQMVERVGATLSLVLPAGLDAEESADIGYAFAQRGATTMVASKMDQAGRVGGIIAAAACGLTLTYGSCSSSIVGGLVPLTANVLANRLLTLPS